MVLSRITNARQIEAGSTYLIKIYNTVEDVLVGKFHWLVLTGTTDFKLADRVGGSHNFDRCVEVYKLPTA